MKDLPWFPMYAADFTNSRRVRTMRPEDAGIYILLLCHEWDAGPLPDDLVTLANLANGADPEDVEAVLKQCFTKRSDGWVNERLESERADAVALRERRVLAGRAGGMRSGKVRSSKKMEAQLEQSSSEAQAKTKQSSTIHSHSHSTEQTAVKKQPPSSVAKKAKGWKFCPDDFQPTEAHRLLARQLVVNLDVELAKFRDHEYAKPKSDPGRAFSTWLRTANEYKRNGNGSSPARVDWTEQNDPRTVNPFKRKSVP